MDPLIKIGDRPYFTGKLQGTADYLLPDSLLHKLSSNVATKNLPTSCYTGIGPLLKVCWPHLGIAPVDVELWKEALPALSR